MSKPKDFKILRGVLEKYRGEGGDVVIPDGVTSIGDDAFSSCYNLISIVIPDSVTSIGDNTFSYCSKLTSIVIPDSVTSIGAGAFSYCSSLTSIVIPDSVTTLAGDLSMSRFFGVFMCCSMLKSVTLPSKITFLSGKMFEDCTNLEDIVIPNTVTQIYNDAFLGCKSLKTLTIPSAVNKIGMYTFAGCDNLRLICEGNTINQLSTEWKLSAAVDYLIDSQIRPENASAAYDKVISRTKALFDYVGAADNVAALKGYADIYGITPKNLIVVTEAAKKAKAEGILTVNGYFSIC